MAAWTARRKAFRALLGSDGCVHPASVFDAISAQIAESLDYQLGIFSGSVASLVILGAPDHVLITLSEFVEQLHRITRHSELPIMVDADHGYGNALNVMRTVEELEAAGVAALMIEDTMLPRPFGPAGGALIPVEEEIGKMRAAVAARRDPDLVILGRTTVGAGGSIADTVARLKAYEGTGVDGLFLAGLQSGEQLHEIAPQVRLPLVSGGARPELANLDFMKSHGVRICLQGHQPIQAGYQAVYEALKAFKAGTEPDKVAGLPAKADFAKWTKEAEYAGQMRAYLGGEPGARH